MSWQCKLITEEQSKDPSYIKQYGDMMFAPKWSDYWNHLSLEYKRDWADKRPPILVWIPMICGDGVTRGHFWCPDNNCSDKQTGWIVTDIPPSITVHPSINAIGSYHGWLQNEILTDDIEGRTY